MYWASLNCGEERKRCVPDAMPYCCDVLHISTDVAVLSEFVEVLRNNQQAQEVLGHSLDMIQRLFLICSPPSPTIPQENHVVPCQTVVFVRSFVLRLLFKSGTHELLVLRMPMITFNSKTAIAQSV
jgi:hypothetical protein